MGIVMHGLSLDHAARVVTGERLKRHFDPDGRATSNGRGALLERVQEVRSKKRDTFGLSDVEVVILIMDASETK